MFQQCACKLTEKSIMSNDINHDMQKFQVEMRPDQVEINFVSFLIGKCERHHLTLTKNEY